MRGTSGFHATGDVRAEVSHENFADQGEKDEPHDCTNVEGLPKFWFKRILVRRPRLTAAIAGREVPRQLGRPENDAPAGRTVIAR